MVFAAMLLTFNPRDQWQFEINNNMPWGGFSMEDGRFFHHLKCDRKVICNPLKFVLPLDTAFALLLSLPYLGTDSMA